MAGTTYNESGEADPGLAVTIDILSKDSYAFVENAIARAIQESEHCEGIILLSIYPAEDG